jgi:hypothetical protein
VLAQARELIRDLITPIRRARRRRAKTPAVPAARGR